MSLELSVVIPVKSGACGLDRLLRSLAEQRGVAPFEVHVVFNPRADKVKNHDLPLQVWTSGLGVNRARNCGVEHARGRWIYFLDADCVLPHADHLRTLLEELRRTAENVVCGGPYLLPDGSGRVSQAYHWVQDRWIYEGAHLEYGWVHLLGGNLAVARSLFSTLKFDEDIVFGGSETDWIARWLLRGGRGKFLPHLGVAHVQSLSTLQLLHKAFLQGYGFERLVSRGLLVKGPRRSLRAAEEYRESQAWIDLYAEVFTLGRDAFVRSPEAPPQRLWLRWWLLKNRVPRRWHKPSAFGAEIRRWREAQLRRRAVEQL
jgi:glycosyltransferase involved in cell wall biosynthesis